MVKRENPNFSLPPLCDVPPGFQPHPPKPCTFAAAAAAGKSPNPYRQKLPLPTSLKRPDGPRRRGRPPKARSFSHLSNQAIETRNVDQVSSKDQSSDKMGSQNNTSPSPHDIVNRALVKCASTFHTHHNNDETLFDTPLTEVACPVSSSFETVGKTQGNVDLNILQQVANALNHNMLGNAVDGTKVNSRFSDMDKNLADTLKAINEKYGDITKDCSLESDCMKTLVLIGVCKVVQDLQKKQLEELDIGFLDSCYTAVRDAESMKVNVRWLSDRLDEIKDAVRSSDEGKRLVDERNRRLENIDKEKKEVSLRKAEMEKLKSEIQDLEDRLVQEAVLVDELNKKISARTTRFSELQRMYVVDGLV
ncbi:hypothetical protein ACP275_05G105300 [Erythranthe tilingii]